jgi:hypothetical protein
MVDVEIDRADLDRLEQAAFDCRGRLADGTMETFEEDRGVEGFVAGASVLFGIANAPTSETGGVGKHNSRSRCGKHFARALPHQLLRRVSRKLRIEADVAELTRRMPFGRNKQLQSEGEPNCAAT